MLDFLVATLFMVVIPFGLITFLTCALFGAKDRGRTTTLVVKSLVVLGPLTGFVGLVAMFALRSSAGPWTVLGGAAMSCAAFMIVGDVDGVDYSTS